MRPFTQIVPAPDGHRVPMMMTCPLAPDLDGPFLVTSSKNFLWIAEKFPSGVVRAAVRKAPVPFMWRNALLEVARMSRDRGWDSLHPVTREGVQKAVDHLIYFGFEELEVLCGDKFDTRLVPEGVDHHEENWVPSGWAVVLPTDRTFVGTTFDFADGQLAMVIHNASRGVAIIADGLPEPTAIKKEMFSKRVFEGLTQRGVRGRPVRFLEELGNYSREDLLTIKGFGSTSLGEVEQFLEETGITLQTSAES